MELDLERAIGHIHKAAEIDTSIDLLAEEVKALSEYLNRRQDVRVVVDWDKLKRHLMRCENKFMIDNYSRNTERYEPELDFDDLVRIIKEWVLAGGDGK